MKSTAKFILVALTTVGVHVGFSSFSSSQAVIPTEECPKEMDGSPYPWCS